MPLRFHGTHLSEACIPYSRTAGCVTAKNVDSVFRCYIKFHQLFARELEARTEAIAQLVQEEIVEWLKAVKEMRAAAWFEKTWTGEHGSHTNASAGYVGNNKASGCESNWKYAKRDTVESAGSNMSMSLQKFIP